MTQAENCSRPNKGILKWSKSMLSRSASLQSKRTCFKEEYSKAGVESLSKTFNFGCSLDVPDWPPSNRDSKSSSKSCASNDGVYDQTIAEEEDILQQQNPDFIERRKSFEMKANVDNFQGVVDLRAVLAHRIPDLEPEDDDDEKPSLKLDQKTPGSLNTAQSPTGYSCTKSDSHMSSLDVEMKDN